MMKSLLLHTLVVFVLCLPSMSFASDNAEEFDWVSEITTDLDLGLDLDFDVEESPSWSLYIGGWSHHLTSNDYDYNEANKLFGVKYEDWVVATFQNSFYDQTYMFGYDFNTQWYDLQFGLVTGVTYGYDPEDVTFLNYKGFMPVVLPYVAYTGYNVVPTLGLLGNALIFTLEYRF